MKARLAPLLALPLLVMAVSPLACLQQISTGTGTTDSSGGGTGTAPASTGTGAATPTGGLCGTDPQTGVTLCSQISLCPSITVDQNTLSGCGFKIHPGPVIDLECLCNQEALCPIGVADTCDQASALLASADLFSICEQTAQSRCAAVGTDASVPAFNSTQNNPMQNPGTCDKTCEAECAGEPDCLQLCGC
jgi:hypothetical protein